MAVPQMLREGWLKTKQQLLTREREDVALYFS
jgi:hypothetical protein